MSVWLRSWVAVPQDNGSGICDECGKVGSFLWTEYQPHKLVKEQAEDWIVYCETCIDGFELDDRFEEIQVFENQRGKLRKQYKGGLAEW